MAINYLNQMIKEADNTQNSALLVLRDKGYKLWIVPNLDSNIPMFTDWRAEKNGWEFSATDPTVLLGMISMHEYRGDDWQLKTDEPNISDDLFFEAYQVEE